MAWELRQFNRAIPKELFANTRGKYHPVVDIGQVVNHILLCIRGELLFDGPVSLRKDYSLCLGHCIPGSLHHAFIRAILNHIDAQGVHSPSRP